jgi:hypothetical protein
MFVFLKAGALLKELASTELQKAGGAGNAGEWR